MRRHSPVFVMALALPVIFAAGAAAQPQKPVPAQTAQAAKPAPAATTASPIDGRWEGTVDTPEGVATSIAELKLEAGTIKGAFSAGQYAVTILGGTLSGEAVTMTMDVNGMAGLMSGTLKDGVLQGTWVVEQSSGAFSFKKAAAVTAPAQPATDAQPANPAAAPSAAPASASDLVGSWDAVADAGGQAYPFTLVLKIEGEKVAGSVESPEGALPIEGTFTNGVVTFAFTRPDGMAIVMSGKLDSGKLVGSFDVNGGAGSGGWSAARRK